MGLLYPNAIQDRFFQEAAMWFHFFCHEVKAIYLSQDFEIINLDYDDASTIVDSQKEDYGEDTAMTEKVGNLPPTKP
ncbi:hypothetical protein U1Q18_003512 [Sarracenia purpurea var. burkii]